MRSRMLASGFIEHPLEDDRVHCFLSDDIETCLPVISNLLTPREKRQVYALHTQTARPGIFELGRIKTIEALETQIYALWLGDMLIDRRYRSLMQPIVKANDRKSLFGYEFLLRGLHTDGTDIPAPTLFDTAETCEMLFALDMAAGESATRTAKLHNIEAQVFVNVLPHTIADESGLDAWLQAVLSTAEIPTDQIVFELVESQQLADVNALGRLIDKLRGQGLRVAMDDFGTGFNNLVGLIEAAPDFIKLDKSLTNNISDDPRKLSMIEGLVDTAKQSKIEVIAEGVEDQQTADALANIKVDYLQGYFIGYPSDQEFKP